MNANRFLRVMFWMVVVTGGSPALSVAQVAPSSPASQRSASGRPSSTASSWSAAVGVARGLVV